MSCLGGAPGEPLAWMRFIEGQPIEQEGRVLGCMNEDRDTRRSVCYGCPAYRGVDREGEDITGILSDGSIVALNLREYAEYQRWVEEEQEPERFFAWMEGGARRGWKTVEGSEAQAEYMREWRATHPGYDQRHRFRAEYMQRYRQHRKEAQRNP